MRKYVRMFVRINMADDDAGGLYLAYLGFGFATNLFLRKFFSDGSQRKFFQAASESCSSASQRLQAGDDGLFINQHNMAANAKLRLGFGQGDCLIERRRVSHQGCGG